MLPSAHQYDIMPKKEVSDFLARHVPKQLMSPRQTCYRHRTDIGRMPVPKELSRAAAQKVDIFNCIVSENN